jgi:hypothetical protein
MAVGEVGGLTLEQEQWMKVAHNQLIIIAVEPKKKKEKNVTSNRQVTICWGKQDLYWGSQLTIQFAPV